MSSFFTNTVVSESKAQSGNLSVIVVSYNTREMTLECLRSVFVEIGDVPVEVWVVDNGSGDGSGSAIRAEFPSVLLIENRSNVGFGAANNQALRQATGEFLLLLNSDAFPRAGAFRALLDHLDHHPTAAVAAPKLLNRDGSLQRSCYHFPSPVRAIWENLLLTAAFPRAPVVGDYRTWAHDIEREVDFAIGACLLVRRAALATVGLFDETFFLYGEEADWCYRFRKAGWKIVFTPHSEVFHFGGASGKPQADQVFCEFRKAQERFIRKHHGPIGLLIYRIMLIVGAFVRILAFSVLSLVRPSQRAKYISVIRLWWRILLWTIGFRGVGLANLPPAAPNPEGALC